MLFACLILLFVHTALCEVIELTDENFDETTSGKKAWMLEFFAPWCGHCKKLAPIYEDASTKMTAVKFGAIDATTHKKLASRFKIDRFPTLKFYENSIDFEYNGGRDADSMVKYIQRMLRDVVRPISEVGETDPTYSETVSAFFLVTDKPETKKITKKAANYFKPDLHCWEAKSFMEAYDHEPGLDMTRLSLNFTGIININMGRKPLTLPEPFTFEQAKEFFDNYRFPFMTKLDSINFRETMESSSLLVLMLADAKHEESYHGLTQELLRMYIKKPKLTQEKDENGNVPIRFVLTDVNEFHEWMENNFHTDEDSVPILVVFDPEEEAYWKTGALDADMVAEFRNGTIPPTYVRNIFARKARKLSNWLDSLSGWQVVVFMLSVVVGLGAFLVLLDRMCDVPPEQYKKTRGPGKPKEE